MFIRGSTSGSKYRDICQIRSQAAWALGGRSLLKQDGLSIQKYSSSASSKRWQTRQLKDRLTINAKVQGLKSRAAFKLLEVSSSLRPPHDLPERVLSANHTYQINEKYKIFRGGQTVVDLVRRLSKIQRRALRSLGLRSWILVAGWSPLRLYFERRLTCVSLL